MKKIQLILAAAGLIASTGLEAQSKTKTPPDGKTMKVEGENCVREKEGLTTCHFTRWKEDSSLIKRAAIGVSVQTTGTKRDTLGVFIARVTPDGPAEKAGIVEGERIVSINGVDLRVAAADVEDSYTAGLASHRLTREIQKLTPGAAVSLRVYSGGRVRDVSVTTARAADLMKTQGNFGMVFPRMPNMPAMPHMQIFRDEVAPLRMLQEMTGTPRASSPMKIRIAPAPRPSDFYFEEDVSVTPPSVVVPAKVKVSKISQSI
ncbi:MAG: PDZ domain-containing protein [Gemmatimonadaceae bacterium]|nr:PDZ domain-containing protein [Gemmatimonadaceae bacterium]